MDLREARELAERKIAEHCPEYRFKWMSRKNTFGLCRYSTKEILLSKLLVERNAPQRVLETIMHEIAHALHPTAHHGRAWKLQMIAFGYTPRRCFSNKDTEVIKGIYTCICGNCGPLKEYHRKPRIVSFKPGETRVKLPDRHCAKCKSRNVEIVKN